MRHTCFSLGLRSTGFALVMTGLLFVCGVNSANANGYFEYESLSVSNDKASADSGSSASFSPGTTTAASCGSVYSAGPDSYPVGAFAHGDVEINYTWVNSDSLSPHPTNAWDLKRVSKATGSASLSGASASSSATLVSGSAPTSYDQETTLATPQGSPPPDELYFDSSAAAETDAGPDSSADPTKENYGYGTAASAGGSTSISVIAH